MTVKNDCISEVHTPIRGPLLGMPADSEWCGTVNAMVVKNVKDANVPLTLSSRGGALCTPQVVFLCITRKRFYVRG